jgi:hypothetical protein
MHVTRNEYGDDVVFSMHRWSVREKKDNYRMLQMTQEGGRRQKSRKGTLESPLCIHFLE